MTKFIFEVGNKVKGKFETTFKHTQILNLSGNVFKVSFYVNVVRVFVTVQGLEEAQSMVGIFARIRRILFYGFDLNDNVGLTVSFIWNTLNCLNPH